MKEAFVEYITRELPSSPVLIACGLPASNKTETTEVIARVHGYTMLRSDIIRLEVLKNEDIFDEKVAANFDKRRMVYDEMFRQAEEIAARGQGVILDATFVTQSLRRRAAEVAARHGRPFVVQQTRCSKEYSLAKLAKRTKENYESNALTEQAYVNNLKKWQPVDLGALKDEFPSLAVTHLVVDTTSDLESGWYVVERTDA